ncbi:MAG: hypothetical protein HUN05_00755 [Desulfobacter sp.]|nr:MAG: hypothetical protein HUN05_00755 [Desulfobacter sp.]
MDPKIQNIIDSVLDKIMDSQSGMSVLSLGLVQKVRYNETEKKLIVFLNPMGKSKTCCSALNMTILADLEKKMESDFARAFPGFAISFANAQ